ncbi:hypothetical protein KRP22_014607 [Phytophthora ramorum]|nr:hypothetical protein KRP22_14383 [Phytophthora ramorum]
MNSSVLCPPNIHLLSDQVINVIARLPRTSHGITNGIGHQKELGTALCQSGRNFKLTQSAAGTKPPGDAKRKRNETLVRASTPDDNSTSLFELGRRIRRKKHREIKRRSRKRKTDLLTNLVSTTEQLREEVNQLQERRSRITSLLLARKSIWSVAVEYFKLFRCELELGTRLPKHAARAQLDFVQGSLASDVASAAGNGPDVVMESWGILQLFNNVKVQVGNMEKNADNSLVVSTRTSVTITSRTLSVLFPHLCTDGGDDKLAQKLLNQRIDLSGSTRFQLDDASERVTSLVTQSDFFTPMLRLLGSLDAVAFAFEHALLSPDFLCRSEP